MLEDYLPQRVNYGPWLPAYTLNHLRELPVETEFILPVISLATPYAQVARLGEYVLPPLFQEALNADLKQKLVKRIVQCFPQYDSAENLKRVKVVELPAANAKLTTIEPPSVLAFSVDTAVEEHGPHLPLGTDTIQSYSVLKYLSSQHDRFELARPIEYGQLTWGLPFGFSVDITTELLTEYVTGYCNALIEWFHPEALYVVDVHGSISHRQAIVQGLENSYAQNWAFRWLHDPLQEFSSVRGDQHAGGVETILVERVSQDLLDASWWPSRLDDLVEKQMTFKMAVELAPQLTDFFAYVTQYGANGIIGDLTNYQHLNADLLFQRMVATAQDDVQKLIAGNASASQNAGQNLW